MKNIYCTVVACLCLLALTVSISRADQVVVYTSLDQVFSEPILRQFEQQTGIEVKSVFDVEAAKTTGLVNRLIAEKNYPKADVFWNSEVSRTLVLKQKGILTPYHSASALDIPSQFKDPEGYWTGFAARSRVLIYNTRLLKPKDLPNSIFELSQNKWRAKVALAYPLFGTTATHIAALYSVIGTQQTEAFLQALKANQVVIVDGNALVRDLVVRGEVAIGFTDTDDVYVAKKRGQPVDMLFPDEEGIGTLVIPNTVALINGAPNQHNGQRLIDYLLSREVESRLAYSDSMQIPLRDGVAKPDHVPSYSNLNVMKIDYQLLAGQLDQATRFCRRLFIR